MASPDASAPKKPSGSTFIALGIVAIIASAFFFTTYAINWSSAKHFQYEGREAQGEVEALNWSTTRTLYASYKYADEFGAEHHGSDAYPLADAVNLKVGQSLDIIYLAPNPDKSRIGAHQSMMMNSLRIAPWATIGYMAAGGFLSLIIGVRTRNRRG